jgi:uncharacterized protein (DUF2062 family)
VTWFRRRIWGPLLALLQTGLSPRGLAWSVAVGLGLGVFPLLGSTTILCVGAAFVFRLNQPAMQLVNYLVYPLQLVLLIPFIRMGERLFGAPPLPLSLSGILQTLKADAFGGLATLWTRVWHACEVWLLVALPAMVLLAFILRLAFETAARRFKAEPG